MSKLKDFFKDDKAVRYSLFIFINAAVLSILFFTVKNMPEILSAASRIISSIFSAFAPLVTGLIIAYILSPLADLINRTITSKIFLLFKRSSSKTERISQDELIASKKSEKLSYLISIFLSLLLVILLMVLIIYALATLISGSSKPASLPDMVQSIYGYFTTLRDRVTSYISMLPEGEIRDSAISIYSFVTTWLSNSLTSGKIISMLSGIGSTTINIALGTIVSIYLLNDKEFFLRLWRKLLHLTLSQKKNAIITETLHDINRVVSMFVRGATVDAIIIAVISSAVLSIYGLPLAVFLGCFAGITNVIPYFGPVLGMVPAFISGFFSGGFGYGLGAVLLLLVIQQLDCNIIYPKIVGRSTGLHPLFILLSVSVFGYYGGIAGMILAVPVAGIIQILILKLIRKAA